MNRKRPLVYVIAQNGMKIRIKPFVVGSLLRYATNIIQRDIAAACNLPVDILFPEEVSKCSSTKEKNRTT